MFEKIEVKKRRTLFFVLMLGIVLTFSVNIYAESKLSLLVGRVRQERNERFRLRNEL